MALIWADKVAETTTTTGTGALTLAGAITGYRAFSSVMTSPSDTCYYMITAVDANGIPTGDWEAGLGTYSASNTLTRTTVQASSNSGAVVSFAVGTKRVTVSATAGFVTTVLATKTETLIDSVVTSGSQASVTFSSIVDTYKALIVRVLGRSNISGSDNDTIILQFNGDTAANYNWVRDGGAQPGGNFVSGAIGTATAVMGYLTGALSPAGQPGWTEAYIPHYADTTWKKCGWSKFVGMGASPSIYGGNAEWSWNNTAAIADILVKLSGSNTFVDGSIVELIGVGY